MNAMLYQTLKNNLTKSFHFSIKSKNKLKKWKKVKESLYFLKYQMINQRLKISVTDLKDDWKKI
jgi:hypothetical protein